MSATMRAARFDAAARRLTVTDVPVVVPYVALASVPDGIPFEQAAVLADAVATPYAALTARAGLRAGEAVGLWGIGGLGVHAVQIARLVGAAPILAFDPLPTARERARALEADIALDPRDGDGVERLVSRDGDPVRLVVQPWS